MTNLPDESERREIEAMEALTSGEERELNGIMDRWSARVTAFLYRMTGNPATAADLAQETFVRLYLTRAKFRPRHSSRPFSTWLFGIASNLARNHHRWHRRHPETTLEEAPEPSHGNDPLKSAERSERGLAVRRAVAHLPSDLREALVLAEYEGLTLAEIGMIAGCSAKAVERRLARAREILRKELAGWMEDKG